MPNRTETGLAFTSSKSANDRLQSQARSEPEIVASIDPLLPSGGKSPSQAARRSIQQAGSRNVLRSGRNRSFGTTTPNCTEDELYPAFDAKNPAKGDTIAGVFTLSGINEGEAVRKRMSSQLLSLSRLCPGDLVDVEAVLNDLQSYSTRVDGVGRRPGAAVQFVTARPPGTRLEDKYSFVAREIGRPVGLLDVINRYPSSGTAFIGLLAVRESLQGRGLGRALYREAEDFIRNDLAASDIKLAVVEANPVSGFWRRMGFVPTGEVKPYEGQTVVSRSILMAKSLRASEQ